MKSNPNAKFMKMRRCIAAMLAGLGLAFCVQAQDTNLNFQATQAAADKGDAKAQYELARCYAKGMGVPKDYFKGRPISAPVGRSGMCRRADIAWLILWPGPGCPQKPHNCGSVVSESRRTGQRAGAICHGWIFMPTARGVTNDMSRSHPMVAKGCRPESSGGGGGPGTNYTSSRRNRMAPTI